MAEKAVRESKIPKKANVSKFKRPTENKLGTFIVLGLIVVYFAVSLFSMLTRHTVATYEVQQGTIMANNVYKGLILRSETVAYAPESGYINYYVKNGTKVAVTDPVYSIDTKGDIAKDISKSAVNGAQLADKQYSSIMESIDRFVYSYNSMDSAAVYTFKQNLASELNQDFSLAALNSLNSKVLEAVDQHSFFLEKSDQAGVIVYSVDGMEDIEASTFQPEYLDSSSYVKTSLDNRTEVQKSDAIYKCINSENWNVIVKISPELANTMATGNSTRVRFCKDNFTANASYTVDRKDGNYYLNLKLKTGMVRYASDRYTDVELVLSENTGLKIPNSSLFQHEFYRIPAAYVSKGGDNNEWGFLVKDAAKNTAVFQAPTYTMRTDDYVYYKVENIEEGITLASGTDTYVVGTDKVTLDCVYSVNRGYTVTKIVEVLSRNNDYVIVSGSTSQGIVLYDHIALDCKDLVEGQTIVD